MLWVSPCAEDSDGGSLGRGQRSEGEGGRGRTRRTQLRGAPHLHAPKTPTHVSVGPSHAWPTRRAQASQQPLIKRPHPRHLQSNSFRLAGTLKGLGDSRAPPRWNPRIRGARESPRCSWHLGSTSSAREMRVEKEQWRSFKMCTGAGPSGFHILIIDRYIRSDLCCPIHLRLRVSRVRVAGHKSPWSGRKQATSAISGLQTVFSIHRLCLQETVVTC
jgi:hypothetical protein